ncbi:MAG: hypothetical protein KC620_03825 [Myxococcales bacterium]|nr:hypothetical protein [Myxococcales bacterium]
MPLSSLLLWTALAAPPLVVPPMAGGIAINEPDQDRFARFVAGAGLDTVQVTLYAEQGDWDSADLDYTMAVFRDLPALDREVAAARAQGLQTLMVLRTKLDHARPRNRHLWHGMIWPDDAALDDWFARYRAFILWGADRAAEMGVDVLLIGHELNSLTATAPTSTLPSLYGWHLDPDRTEPVLARRAGCAGQQGDREDEVRAFLEAEDAVRRRWTSRVTGLLPRRGGVGPAMPPALAARRARYEAFWRQLIIAVRQRFPGPIGYGANYDQFAEVGFWDALDLIAVTSYFPLSTLGTSDAALDARLEAGWRAAIAQIEAVAQKVDRPVLFHELGWHGQLGSTVRPYAYAGVDPIETGDPTNPTLTCVRWSAQPEAPGERLRALAALIKLVEGGDFPALRGFSLWKITTEPEQRQYEPFAVVLPPPYVNRDADHGFVLLAQRLAGAIAAQAWSLR